MINRKNIVSLVIGFMLCIALFRFCDGSKGKTITEVKTKVIKVTDTLKVKGDIVTNYKKVYVKKIDTVLVYVDIKDSTTIDARVYEQPIVGKRSSGIAKITTNGELLDFSAIIECQDSIIERNTTKYIDRSQLFLYGQYKTNNQLEIGLDWNLRNKVILKGGVGYDASNTIPYISVGIGIPIF